MTAIKENSIASFNAASAFPIDFVEFDVQMGVFAYLFFSFSNSLKKRKKKKVWR